MVGPVASLFNLSRILLVGGGLLGPSSLPGPPGKLTRPHKTHKNGYNGARPGWMDSVNVYPNSYVDCIES